MNDIILIDSRYSTNRNILATYDVIEYNGRYYCGINLFKNFFNFLSNAYLSKIYTFNSRNEAILHFNNISF